MLSMFNIAEWSNTDNMANTSCVSSQGSTTIDIRMRCGHKLLFINVKKQQEKDRETERKKEWGGSGGESQEVNEGDEMSIHH